MNHSLTYAEQLQYFAHQVVPTTDAYATNVLAGKTRALINNYPAVQAILGADIFHALATVYVQHQNRFMSDQPDWDINQIGEGFSALLLAQQQGTKANAFAWQALSQLADIEYGLVQLYYSDSVEIETHQTLLPRVLPSTELLHYVQWLVEFVPWLRLSSSESVENMFYPDSMLSITAIRTLTVDAFCIDLSVQSIPSEPSNG